MTQKQHHRAKLTADQVRAMRAAYVPGKVGYETLAARFGCGISTARGISAPTGPAATSWPIHAGMC
jgi:hypothetical protein